MFRGPSFIVSTMQEGTTPIFKRFWYDWTQQQPGIEPTNPLGQCWVPPIVAFYDQQGLLRTYSLPGGSIKSPQCWSTVSSGPLEGTSWRARDNHRSVHCQRMPDNTVKAFMDSVLILEPLVSSLTPPACSVIDMALRPKPIALGPTQFMQINQETSRLKRRDDGILEATKKFYVTFDLD